MGTEIAAEADDLTLPPTKRLRTENGETVTEELLQRDVPENKVTSAVGAVFDDDEDKQSGANYPSISRRNEKLEAFYRATGNVPPEEWDAFVTIIREPLPSSFRITGFRTEAEAMKNILNEKYLAKLNGDGTDPLEKPLVKPLKFYPRGLAYQLDLSKRELRRSDILGEFRKFLVAEDGCGNVSRQETVSMIPPILLQVQPGHKVLDMCAAPGSKTGQIIEMLHTNFFSKQINPSSEQERVTDLINTDGLVVANDADYKRCHLLNHQMKRLHTPCLIITNHDAAQFPNVRLPTPDSPGDILAFDRILCDVPCSGDGTIRKNLDMWKRWTPTFSFGLHYRQFLILKRGLELLAVGGRLVYSTCSMNPVENEAIIARALRICNGGGGGGANANATECVRLVEARADIECGGEGLRTMPGLASWPLIDDAGTIYKTVADLPQNSQRGAGGSKMQQDMFPPPAAAAGAYNLERCIRILPHHNNTGGFFVAVLEKLAPLPWQRKTTSAPASAAGAAVPVRLKAPKGFREEPFLLWKDEEPQDWKAVKEFYHVADTFPGDTQCFVRAGSHKTRNVFVVTERVQKIVTLNREKLQICSTGVRILSRSGINLEEKVRYRLVQEGIHVWLPLLGVAVIRATSADDVRALLTEDGVLFDHFSDAVQQQVRPLGEGSVVVVHEGKFALTIHLIAWRATCTLKCYVAQKDREHFLRLLNETSSS